MIDPQIGFSLWYKVRPNAEPFPAIVTHVHSIRVVDVVVFDLDTVSATIVRHVSLYHPEDELPTEADRPFLVYPSAIGYPGPFGIANNTL